MGSVPGQANGTKDTPAEDPSPATRPKIQNLKFISKNSSQKTEARAPHVYFYDQMTDSVCWQIHYTSFGRLEEGKEILGNIYDGTIFVFCLKEGLI
jgi:hypothetical protein